MKLTTICVHLQLYFVAYFSCFHKRAAATRWRDHTSTVLFAENHEQKQNNRGDETDCTSRALRRSLPWLIASCIAIFFSILLEFLRYLNSDYVLNKRHSPCLAVIALLPVARVEVSCNQLDLVRNVRSFLPYSRRSFEVLCIKLALDRSKLQLPLHTADAPFHEQARKVKLLQCRTPSVIIYLNHKTPEGHERINFATLSWISTNSRRSLDAALLH